MEESALPPGARLAAMPLEGHYKRVNTPLRKLTGRELKVLIVGSLVTLVALLGLIFIPGSTDRPLAPGPDCIEVAVAGRVGSEPVAGCGEKAKAICRRATEFDDPRADTIVQACVDEKIRF
jgi:hypothetical protein